MYKKISVKKRNGRLEEFNPDKINKRVERACENLDSVSASEIVLDAQISFNDKVKTAEIDQELIFTARSKIYKHPNYSWVASRLLLNCLYKEVFKESVDCDTFVEDYKSSFIKNIKKGVKSGVYSENLLEFDLKDLSSYIDTDRDLLYRYVGIQNLYDRYLLRINDKVIETPQHFLMRVAMGICINEEDKNERAKELYDVYSKHLASPSTPTLFNSGTPNNQLSSCYLSEIGDSIDGIFDGLWQEARKSKHAGGLGFHMTKIRGTNSKVRGTNGKSGGLIPWMKIYNDMLIAADQGGRRKGSGAAYLEPWHIDIEEFIDVRKDNGEERRRCHDLNTALWIPDLFFKRIEEEGKWTLFCPDEVKGLDELFGDKFERQYKKYEKLAEEDEIKNYRTIEAKDLWKKILKSLFETSHPWPTFKDNANLRYSNIHEGTIHGSNLCLSGNTKVNVKIYDNNTDYYIKTTIDLKTLTAFFNAGTNEDIYVLSFNIETKKAEYKKISAAALIQKNASVIRLDDTSYGNFIYCTPDHKIYTNDRGYIKCLDLKENDSLVIKNDDVGSHRGTEVECGLQLKMDVYDISVEDNNNFFANNILVHNCNEIYLHTKASKYADNSKFGQKTEIGETAVCNLASVCLANHLIKNEDGTYKINYEQLKDTISKIIRGLDNVIDINFYPTEEAYTANSKHRPIGMGAMGWADVFSKLGMPQDSDEAVALCDELMEFISYHAILNSSKLAKERGKYYTYEGSLWDKDTLPIDSYNNLIEWKGVDKIGSNGKLDWTPVREHIKEWGMRNSNTMAIAPNASIAYLLACEQSIEPYFRMLFRYENLSGNYMIVNPFFVEKMEEAELWSEELAEALSEADGDVTLLNIPNEYKELFKPAPENNQFKLIEGNAARQKWIDQGISFNLYNGGKQSVNEKTGKPSLKFLNDIYLYANKSCLKGTYYLRNKSASTIQKVTSKKVEEKTPEAIACSINNPESCEMCEG